MSDADREAEMQAIKAAAAVMLARMNAQVVVDPKKEQTFGTGTPAASERLRLEPA